MWMKNGVHSHLESHYKIFQIISFKVSFVFESHFMWMFWFIEYVYWNKFVLHQRVFDSLAMLWHEGMKNNRHVFIMP